MKYIRENKVTLNETTKEGAIVMTKTVRGYDLRITFAEEVDQDEEDNEGEEKDEDENKEFELEQTGKYTFTVDLKPHGKESPAMRIYSVSAKDEKLYFEGLSFADSWAEIDKEAQSEQASIDHVQYDDLAEETQDKIADFMDLLKVDDYLAKFIQAAAAESKRKTHIRVLQKLEKFLKA